MSLLHSFCKLDLAYMGAQFLLVYGARMDQATELVMLILVTIWTIGFTEGTQWSGYWIATYTSQLTQSG